METAKTGVHLLDGAAKRGAGRGSDRSFALVQNVEAAARAVEVRGHVDRLSGSNHHDGSSEWPLKAHAMRVRSCPRSCPDHEGRTGARAATLSQLVSFVSGTVDGCRARARFSRVTTKVERWSSMPSLVWLGRCGARSVYSILSPQNPLHSTLELTSELTSSESHP